MGAFYLERNTGGNVNISWDSVDPSIAMKAATFSLSGGQKLRYALTGQALCTSANFTKYLLKCGKRRKWNSKPLIRANDLVAGVAAIDSKWRLGR